MTLPGLGAAAFVLSFLIARLVLPRLEGGAGRSGLLDEPGDRKDHGRPMPLAGGVAILLAVAVPSVAGLLLAVIQPLLALPLSPELLAHLPGVRSRAPELLAILLLAGLHLVLGYLDDRFELPPSPRLLVELAAGAALAALGMRITAGLPGPILHWILTMAFVAFTTNAVNFLDTMNGLMAGVVYLGTLHLVVLGTATGQLFMVAILLCLAGSLLAFLGRNFPRATVFMGDSGTLSVGFLLAALCVAFTFDPDHGAGRPFLGPAVILPLLILLVPLGDGLLVVAARVRAGRHPFAAGRDHLSHRLAARLGSRTKATILLWAVAFLAGLPASLRASPAIAVAVLAPGLLLLALVTLANARAR
jgi:UDP-GlcNAc:undecaprenyl-phosphate GlcNAc-1-phosphate transferase